MIKQPHTALIVVIAGTIFYLLAPLLADAEAMPVYQMQPMTVVAPNLLAPSTYLPTEELRSAKPVDLAALVSGQLPSASPVRKGPLAGDILLRGLSRDNVQISIDQTKTYCACPNRMDPPAFHISSQQIDAISVRTGPFRVDEGASLGGTITVSTSEPPTQEAFARLYGYAGSFNYAAAGITAGSPLTDTTSALGGFYYQRGGIYEDGSGTPFTQFAGTNYLPSQQQRTAYDVRSLETKLNQSLPNEAKLALSYAMQDARDVLHPGLRMDAPTDRMHRVSAKLSKPVNTPLADMLEAAIAWSHVDHDMTDSLRTSINNMGGAFASRGYFMRTRAESAHLAAKLQATRQRHNNELRYGLNASRRLWDANNVIGSIANDMLPDVVADQLGIWGAYEYRNGPWAYEAGLRLDLGTTEARENIGHLQSIRRTNTNKRTDLMPSLYGLIGRDLGKQWNLYTGLGLATRQPDPQERYINLDRPNPATNPPPDWVGNPDLDPVSNFEQQSGIRWQGKSAHAELSLFHSWLHNAIYLEQVTTPSNATSYTNIDARLYGFSAQATWEAAEQLQFQASAAWQEGVKENLPTNASNDIFAEIPPLRGRIAALYRNENSSLKAEVQLQDSLSRIDTDLNERPISGSAVLNLAASHRFNQYFSISSGIDNVLDSTYAVANAFVRDPFSNGTIVNEPGRFIYLRAGVEW